MGKTWVISDTHFGHENIIKYCNRPFKDSYHMNMEMIKLWNETVSPEDFVIHDGDFCFGDPGKYISQLNGKITVVLGNHDKNLLRFLKTNPQKNIRVVDNLTLHYKSKKIHFNHYPLWQESYKHLKVEPYDILLYGHVHNGREDLTPPWNAKNICVERMDYKPQQFEGVVDTILENRV